MPLSFSSFCFIPPPCFTAYSYRATGRQLATPSSADQLPLHPAPQINAPIALCSPRSERPLSSWTMSEATSSTLAAASTQTSGAQATDSASVSTHGPSHPGETAATGELEAGRASNARDEPIPARPTGARQVASDPTSVSTLSRTRSRSAALLTSLLTGSPSVATSSSTSISSVTPCVPTFAQGGPDSPSPITRRQSHASTDESGQVVKDAGWRMPTWGSPMRKENKCAAKGVERSTASQSDDLGLALGLRVDKASPRRSEDGENANAFIDEGISMAEVPGRVGRTWLIWFSAKAVSLC